jgi:cellulose synthase operon protein C
MPMPNCLSLHLARLLPLAALISALVCASDQRVGAQVPGDQAAEMLLNSARKAYNEQNLPFAAARFQEFLQKFGGHPQTSAARYGLALCYLEGAERNYDKAIEQLSHLAGNAALPEQPYAAYYLGLAYRGIALNDLAAAATKHGEEQRQLRAKAEGRLADASRHFATAVNAFAAKLPKGSPPKELPKELDWAARARCDQAEMELRLNKPKEARATAEPFTKDPWLAKSRYRPLGLYYFGFAAFLMQDYLVAGRSLNELAPFSDPTFGLHARYLMGRIYQVSEEADKALAMYDGVLADFDKQKKEAVESLKRPEQFKKNPAERARLEGLVKGPAPDFVGGSVFFSACLQYEAGKFADALGRFQAFGKEYSASPFAPDAALRVGYCQVQLKQFAEAAQTLAPLVDKHPKLADQALFWMGKAQAGAALAAGPMNAPARDNGLKSALATLKTAADRAAAMTADPEAKARRSEILLELADTQQQARLFKEAAALLEQLRNEKALPAREEEVAQRLITAQHLAGDFARSDQLCTAFLKDFPRSTLLPLVLFRSAENAYFTALAAESKPNPNRAELGKLFEESGKRYRLLLERFPEFDRAQLARYGLAMCHFKRNDLEEAQKMLEAIPAADRSGDLSYVPYLLAECLIRSAPAKAEDALQIGMLQEKLQQAQQNLEAFVGASPKASEAPDAMLKLGVCQTRLAVLNAQPQERAQALAAARKTFEALIQQFPNEPQGVQAIMERAKCMSFSGDKNAAVKELRRFTNDPLRQNPLATFALLHLSTLLREQNKAGEAATLLNDARQRFEPGLLKDQPERAALLRFHHGICLQEAGKLAEARAQLETIPTLLPGKPVAVESLLRSGQCRLGEARQGIDNVQKQLGAPNLKPEQRAQLKIQLQGAFDQLDATALWLQTKGEETRDAQPALDARIRLYYEAAWAWRSIAEREVAAARSKLQVELQKLQQAEADKKAAPGSKAAQVPLPEAPRSQVPVQPAEAKARNAYQLLIGYGVDTLLTIESRFELAEMLAERDEHEPAIKLLKEALDKEPSDNKAPAADFLDRVRIRLAACLAAKKEFGPALDKLLAVADNPKSPLVAEAQYRAGECLLELGQADKAVARLALFRDKPEFRNIGGISDRALLRLGHALAALKQWEASRQAFEMFGQRYGGSPWLLEARYGMGWAQQNLGQFDQAVTAYNAVIAGSANELAARSHLQIGLCRLEQKRFGDAAAALLVVPFTFDYPDLSAAALTEAARALIEDKKPEQAERLLRKVIKEYPQNEWAKIAQKRLDDLKP